MKAKIGKFYNKRARKIDITIDKFDTWGLDHTLALIILPCLVQLKDTKHGVPFEFADVGGEDWQDQQCFDFYKETHTEAFDLGCERWNEVLDKIIWSFRQIAFDDFDEKYHHGEPNYDFVPDDTLKPFVNPLTGKTEQLYTMVDTNPGEHWYDSVGHRLHEERIQEGLDLFGKYFRNLWD